MKTFGRASTFNSRHVAGTAVFGRWTALVPALLFLLTAGRAHPFTLISIDPAAERKLGVAIDRWMHGTRKFSHRRDWERRLSSIGRRLSAATGEEGDGITWRYQVINESFPNMMSTCAGYIYSSSGLLKRGFNDDELAGIMSHEMVHVIKHHVARSYLLEYHVLRFDTAVADRAARDLRKFSLGLGGPFQIFRYAERKMDRDFEREADLLGVDIAARAGFDPEGHARALQALLSGRDRHKSLKEALLSTHPPSRERIQRIKTEARRFSKTRLNVRGGQR